MEATKESTGARKYAKMSRPVYRALYDLLAANAELVKTMTSPQLAKWATDALMKSPNMESPFVFTTSHVDGVRIEQGLQRTIRERVKKVSEIAQMKKDILDLATLLRVIVVATCPPGTKGEAEIDNIIARGIRD